MSERKMIEEKKTVPSFEDVLEELGALGKFQLTQCALCYLSLVMMTSVLMSFVFLGYEPPHVCNSVNETKLLSRYKLENDSTAHIAYKSCELQISVENNGKMFKVDTIDCPNGRNFFDAKHTTFLSEWDLVCESKGIAEFSMTLFGIGQIIGGFIASSITDRIGRKPVLISCSFLVCVTELCIVAAPNIFVIYGLRLTSGIFTQGVLSCYFVYGMEFVPTRHREANGVIVCILWVAAVLLTGAFAFLLRNHKWEYFQVAVGTSGLYCLVYPFFLHESPRWLAANGKTEEALHILEKASKTNGKDVTKVKETFLAYAVHAFPSSKRDTLEMLVTSEIQDEEAAVKTDVRAENLTILTILRVKSLRWTTLISIFLYTTNVLTYYGLYMTSSKVAGDRFLNFALLTLVELPSCLCTMFMLKKMSRRLVLKIFLGLTALSLMSSGFLTSVAKGLDGAATTSTVFFIAGKFAITVSFDVFFIMLPELYPTNLRSTAVGICGGFSRVGGMMIPFLNPLFEIVKWGPALIFTVMCGVTVALTMFLPETKDKNLPDTVDDIGNNKEGRK